MCCTFDYSKLRGRIIEVFGSQEKFAEKLKVAPQKVSLTLRSKRALTQTEIHKWAKALGIKMDEYGSFFFTLEVHERES